MSDLLIILFLKYMANIKGIIRYHKLAFAIILFLISFVTVHILKPSFIYNTDGGFRDFGVGYKNKTVVPIWLVAIILAVLSYLAILNYLMYF